MILQKIFSLLQISLLDIIIIYVCNVMSKDDNDKHKILFCDRKEGEHIHTPD